MHIAATDRVPVFRNGQPIGYADRQRRDAPRDLAATIHALPWFDTQGVGVTVEDRVVRLSGHVDSIHAVLALRRIAAAAPGTAAIIDEIWVDCE